MTTIITMRNVQNWAGAKYLGFYNGKELVAEVDPREGGFYVFRGYDLIGIHADEGRAIKHAQREIRASILGTVKFYPDNLSLA